MEDQDDVRVQALKYQSQQSLVIGTARRWTNARLRLAVEARYGVRYSHSHPCGKSSHSTACRRWCRGRKLPTDNVRHQYHIHAAQRDALKEIGIRYAQGYLFQRPASILEFERMYRHSPIGHNQLQEPFDEPGR